MLRWLPMRRHRMKLIVIGAGMFFLRLLFGPFSSSVQLDIVRLKSPIANEELDINDYENPGPQRPLAKHDDLDRWQSYRPPIQSGVSDQVGKRFNVDQSRLRWTVDDMDFVSLTSDKVKEFVVATAASSSFQHYSLAAIATVQRHLPNRTIVFYDLEPKQKYSIAEKMNSACNVQYRAFDFRRYPRHVQNLKNYAWKPLIIAELLTEYPGVLWIDSSIRFFSGNLSIILGKAIETEGMLALTSTGHSNFAVTHPQMYGFLPTLKEGMIKTDQHEANCVLLYRTKPAFESVVWWWTLCALDPLCIAPTNRTNCDDPYKSREVYANCHRFDQSALNILLANYFAYDYMRYFGSQNVVNVMRNNHISTEKLRICRPTQAEPKFIPVLKHRTS